MRASKPRRRLGGMGRVGGGIRQRPKMGAVGGGIGQAQPQGAARQPSPLNDAGYNTQVNALNRDYSDTQSGLQNREFGVREQYGFDPEFAQNPYTRANLLKKSYDQRYTGTTNSMAGRGQLYSGATDRARSADVFAHGAEVDEAQRGYSQELAGIEAERLASSRTKDAGMDSAYADMLQRALENEPDSSLFPAGGAGKRKGNKPGKKPGKRAYLGKVGGGLTRRPGLHDQRRRRRL